MGWKWIYAVVQMFTYQESRTAISFVDFHCKIFVLPINKLFFPGIKRIHKATQCFVPRIRTNSSRSPRVVQQMYSRLRFELSPSSELWKLEKTLRNRKLFAQTPFLNVLFIEMMTTTGERWSPPLPDKRLYRVAVALSTQLCRGLFIHPTPRIVALCSSDATDQFGQYTCDHVARCRKYKKGLAANAAFIPDCKQLFYVYKVGAW